MTDNYQMPFGKHRGEKLGNVPAGYLMWLWDNNIVSVKNWNRVYWYIKENLDAIKAELKNKESYSKTSMC